MKQKNQNGRLKKQWGQITDGLPEFKNLTSYLYSDKVNRNVLYHMVPNEPMMEPISGDCLYIVDSTAIFCRRPYNLCCPASHTMITSLYILIVTNFGFLKADLACIQELK